MLGAEVYASATEQKIVYHTCKSRFCPSCGSRAASVWQEELETVLPQVPHVEINLTMPKAFWSILEQNRHLLGDVPALGAAAIQFWAKATYSANVILMVVQQTYGGFLNFYPHLHTLVSAGGFVESRGQWIPSLQFGKEQHQRELMLAWRFAVLAFFNEAIKGGVLKSDRAEVRNILEKEVRETGTFMLAGRCPRSS